MLTVSMTRTVCCALHGNKHLMMVATRRSMSCSPAKIMSKVAAPGIRKRPSTHGDGPPVKGSTMEGLDLADANGTVRCKWAYMGSDTAEYIKYHDEEWGVPCQDDSRLMEHLILDGAQCGLSWATILGKRGAYAAAFKHYDVHAIAAMDENDVEMLLQADSGIVKHRGKINSAINNAKLVLEIQQEFGSLASYLWGLLPEGRPVINEWRNISDVPTSTPLADSISNTLKKRGFKFVGPTMMYSFMQATGMIHDHTVDCFRYHQISYMHEIIDQK